MANGRFETTFQKFAMLQIDTAVRKGMIGLVLSNGRHEKKECREDERHRGGDRETGTIRLHD